MIKVVMEAKDIPIGSSVTKRGECLRRKLMNEVEVVADGKTFSNGMEQDNLFLMQTSKLSTLEAISPGVELEWIIEWEDDYDTLQKMILEEQLIV